MISDDLYKIDENGLKTATLSEILSFLEEKIKAISDPNADFSQNTPDGQLLNLFAQCQADISELLNYIYNGININTAEGNNLDNLVGLNGIVRQAGSFTEVPITITINQNVSLQGLDDDINNEQGTGFTIQDANGNQYILEESCDLEYSATTTEFVKTFRYQYRGATTPQLEAINQITTPQLGVVSVLNKSAPTNIGSEAESDYELRNRFFNTYQNGSVGSYEGILANVYNVNGVKSIGGENNYTNTTSAKGTPGHSIWLIVDGGSDNDVANAIYQKINVGCGMRGNKEITIKDEFGNDFIVKFDRPITENLYIKFDLEVKETGYVYDLDTIKTELINNLELKVNTLVDKSNIDKVLTENNNNLVYSNIRVSSDGATYSTFVENTNMNYLFTLIKDNITITVK